MPTRRDILKASLLAPAVAAAKGIGPSHGTLNLANRDSAALAFNNALASPTPGAGRERLLLDFGWRFHFGHADDQSKDFEFGGATSGNFRRPETSCPPAPSAFDDSDWRAVDLPHDWAVELPFQNDPGLLSKGYYPLGRKYPATSVGWYRRVLEIPAAMPASGSPSSLTARTAKPWSSSTASTSAGTAAVTILSASTSRTSPIPAAANVLLVRVDATRATDGSTKVRESTGTCGS